MSIAPPRSKAFAVAGLLTLACLLQSCFLTEILPEEKKTKRNGSTPVPGENPPVALINLPDPLPPPRLVRRLSLDLKGRLPLEVDVDTLAADGNTYAQIANAYLDSTESNRAISQMHTSMWKLDPERLAVLDGFAVSDATLAAQLTSQVREQIAAEPALLVRYALEHNRPFSDIFKFNFSIAYDDTLPVWDATTDGGVFTGEPYQALFGDGSRPAAGILSSRGYLAAASQAEDPSLRHRWRRTLSRFLCMNFEAKTAHDFLILTRDERVEPPLEIALKHKACISCHSHIDESSGVFQGLGDGATIADWLVYTEPDGASTSGTFAGSTYSTPAEFAGLMGDDPRTQRCESARLFAELTQRPLSIDDSPTLNLALQSFGNANQSLKAMLWPMVNAPTYKIDAVKKTTSPTLYRKQSGVRFLSRWQWRRLISQIAPTALSVELSYNLEAGYDELTREDRIPTGSYWHEVDRLARQIATAVVATELTTTSQASSRRLLTLLPNGEATTASAALVRKQIVALWLHVSGTALKDADPTLGEFVDLWTAGLNKGAAAEDVQTAWRTLLTGMFSHPDFITY